tara:strand:- start:166 stop:411 length:246 start_codon:yes stop_codon:yes gene_type:complete
MYQYKLKEQPQKEKAFQQERLRAFDEVSDKMAQLKVLVDDARVDTEKFYNENPTTFSVVYSTDLAIDYIEDIIKMFKQDGE